MVPSDVPILRLLGYALFERQADGTLASVGGPAAGARSGRSSLDLDSAAEAFAAVALATVAGPLLDNFLMDAEAFWSQGQPGRLDSGFWEHEFSAGDTRLLQAIAVQSADHSYLLIQDMTDRDEPAGEYLRTGRTTQSNPLRDLAHRDQLAEELRSAKAAAETLLRSRSEVLGNVSHELRTPLAIIHGMCESLLSGATSTRQRDQLSELKNAADALQQSVAEVLDYVELAAESAVLNYESLDLRTFTAAIIESYRGAAEQVGLQLTISHGTDLPDDVVTDPRRLRQILHSLLDNAFKFTEHGSVTLSIERLAGERVGLMVSDTGPGIDESHRSLVFEGLWQVDMSLSKRHRGLGLGLSIVQRAVTALGGSITLESRLGEGSTFRIALPIRPTEPTEPAASGMTASAATTPLKVLVAEDNVVNRKFMIHLLEQAGHTVLVAENGREAVDMVATYDPDVVVMDCQMPVLDGIQATVEIRQRDQRSGSYLPVIAVTAHATASTEDACRRAGMDYFLAKPFSTSRLLGLVRTAAVLNRQSRRDGPVDLRIPHRRSIRP